MSPRGLAGKGAEKHPFCAALEDAIAYKRPEMAAVLASPCGRWADPDAPNYRNLLMNAAAERGMLSVVKAMVEAGFPVSSAGVPNERKGQMINAHPFRPLSWRRARGPVAARPLDYAGTIAVADYLIEYLGGATKETALDAIANGQSSRLKHILRLRPELAEEVGIRSGAAFGLLNSRSGDEMLSVFDVHGAQISGSSADGVPFIFQAIGQPYLLHAFLRAGASPNIQATTSGEYAGVKFNAGTSVLMFAINRDNLNLPGISSMTLLMTSNPDLSLRDANGWTALHYAAQSESRVGVAEGILSKGADVNARDKAGLTPLDHALARNLTKMADVLRSRGGKRGGELAEQ